MEYTATLGRDSFAWVEGPIRVQPNTTPIIAVRPPPGLDHRLAQMVMNEPPCQLCRASSIGASLAGRAEAFGSTVW